MPTEECESIPPSLSLLLEDQVSCHQQATYRHREIFDYTDYYRVHNEKKIKNKKSVLLLIGRTLAREYERTLAALVVDDMIRHKSR